MPCSTTDACREEVETGPGSAWRHPRLLRLGYKHSMPQPHRGDRVPTNVRLPRHMREVAEAIAARDGVGVGEAVTRIFGEALGLSVPEYCLPKSQRSRGDELELPLSKAS